MDVIEALSKNPPKKSKRSKEYTQSTKERKSGRFKVTNATATPTKKPKSSGPVFVDRAVSIDSHALKNNINTNNSKEDLKTTSLGEIEYKKLKKSNSQEKEQKRKKPLDEKILLLKTTYQELHHVMSIEKITTPINDSLKQLVDFCMQEQDYLINQHVHNPNPYISAASTSKHSANNTKKIEKFIDTEVKRRAPGPDFKGYCLVFGTAQKNFWQQLDTNILSPSYHQKNYLSVIAQYLRNTLFSMEMLQIPIPPEAQKAAQNILDANLQELDPAAFAKDFSTIWKIANVQQLLEQQIQFDPKREIITDLFANCKLITDPKFTHLGPKDYQYLQQLLPSPSADISIKFSNLEYRVTRTDRIRGSIKKWVSPVFVDNSIVCVLLDISNPNIAKKSFFEFQEVVKSLRLRNTLFFLLLYGSKELSTIPEKDLLEAFVGFSREHKSVVSFLEERFKKVVLPRLDPNSAIAEKMLHVQVITDLEEKIVPIIRKKAQDVAKEEEKKIVDGMGI